MEVGLAVKRAGAAVPEALLPVRTLGFRDPIKARTRTSCVGFQPPASGAWRKRAVWVARKGVVRSEAVLEEKAPPPMKKKEVSFVNFYLCFVGHIYCLRSKINYDFNRRCYLDKCD